MSRASDDFAAWARALKLSKRARSCLEHLLEHGTLSTEQLSRMGYQHPPRAIRDLRDAGVQVKTSRIKNSDGRGIANYTLIRERTSGRAGRMHVPKAFRDEVNASTDMHCAICDGVFAARELQCDHRVPFEIAGDGDGFELGAWMPLCASCNRSKSWSCEHCPNWTVRDAATCEGCFWAFPKTYKHVATVPERRLMVAFQGDEVGLADALRDEAQRIGHSQQLLIKKLLAERGGSERMSDR